MNAHEQRRPAESPGHIDLNAGAPSSRTHLVIEVMAVVLATLCLMSGMAGFLFRGDTTFLHDNLYWAYPNFTFVAESLLQGTVPLWDPYSHGGEAFFPTLCHGRYLDPTMPLVVFAGRLFTRDSLILFHWLRFTQVWVMLFGVYLLLRRYATTPLTRATLASVVFLSSLAYAPFRQDALLLQFQWIPYVAHLLLGIVFEGRRSWSRWLLLSAAVGVSSQSYWFSSTWIFLGLFAFALACFYRDQARALFVDRAIRAPIAVFALVIVATGTPNLALSRESPELVFSTRSLPRGYEHRNPIGAPIQYEGRPGRPSVQAARMPYAAIEYSGTSLSFWNVLQTLSPSGNSHVHPPRHWGNPAEPVLYIGAFGWALCLFGLFAARHASKPLWLTVTLGSGLLALGPSGMLHRVLYPVFVPLWPVRHPSLYAPLLLLGMLYFMLLGLEAALTPGRLAGAFEGLARARRDARGFALFVLTGSLLAAMIVFEARPVVSSLLVIALGLTLGLARRGLSGLFVATIALCAQTAVAISMSASPALFQARLLVAIGVPFGLVMASRARFERDPRQALSLAALACAAMVLDARDGLHQARALFTRQPRPTLEAGFDPRLSPVTAPGPRRVHPPYRPEAFPAQVIRYMSQLYRVPFALSPPVILSRYPGVADLTFPEAMRRARWNSHFLRRQYFELIHVDLDPRLLANLFAIGRPPFQLRASAVVTTPAAWIEDLRARAVEEASRRLDTVVALHPSPGDLAPPTASSPPDVANAFDYRVVAYTHNDTELEVESARAAHLLWVDGWSSAWRATLDGREVALWRADYAFKALALPAGRHRLHFRYRPWAFIVGLVAFESALALCVVGALASAVARRRARHAPNHTTARSTGASASP